MIYRCAAAPPPSAAASHAGRWFREDPRPRRLASVGIPNGKFTIDASKAFLDLSTDPSTPRELVAALAKPR